MRLDSELKTIQMLWETLQLLLTNNFNLLIKRVGFAYCIKFLKFIPE
jgi:hypothetical protein